MGYEKLRRTINSTRGPVKSSYRGFKSKKDAYLLPVLAKSTREAGGDRCILNGLQFAFIPIHGDCSNPCAERSFNVRGHSKSLGHTIIIFFPLCISVTNC